MVESDPQDKLHPSHVTRISDASSYDEICVNCGRTDSMGSWGRLVYLCPFEPEEHRIARSIGASGSFIASLENKND